MDEYIKKNLQEVIKGAKYSRGFPHVLLNIFSSKEIASYPTMVLLESACLRYKISATKILKNKSFMDALRKQRNRMVQSMRVCPILNKEDNDSSIDIDDDHFEYAKPNKEETKDEDFFRFVR